MIDALLPYPPNIMNHQPAQRPMQPRHAAPHLLRLGNRPQSRARQTKRHRAQDHGLASVRAHVRRVPAPAGLLVHYGEEVEEVGVEGQHGGDGAGPDVVDARDEVRESAGEGGGQVCVRRRAGTFH